VLRNGQSRLTDRLLLARQGHRAGPGSPARQPTIRRASGIARECIGDLLTDDEVGESTAIQRFSMRTSRIRGDGSASPRQAALAVYR
jgi:hypothetical protein